MATIPLPALHTETPQQPNLLQMAAQAYGIKNAQQENQLRAQQVIGAQQANQQGQMGLQDQQAFRSAMQDPSMQGKTIGEVADVLATKGALSQAGYLGLKKADVEHKQQLATLDKTTLENQKAAHDATQNLFNNVMDMPDDKLAANWPSIVQQYNAIPGNQKMQLDPSQPLGKDQLKAFGPFMQMQNSYFDEEIARRTKMSDASKAASDAAKAAAGVNPDNPADPNMAEQKYRGILDRIKAKQPVSAPEMIWAKSYEAGNQKSTTSSDSLGVVSNNTSGPSGLSAVGAGRAAGAPGGASAAGGGQVSPASTKQSIVDVIGQYKMDPGMLNRMMVKHPEIVAQVHNQYPDWDQTTYNAKNKIVQNYTSGPESRSIGAISTALGHAGELGQAIDALNNGNGMNMLRSIGNSLGVNVLGNDKVTAFNTIVHRLAPEITAAYVQGGGGQAERAANEGDFSASLGDKQLRTNLSETIKLLRSKIETQEQQWNNTYMPSRPEDNFSTRFLTPRAQATMQKYAGGDSQPSQQVKNPYR